MSTTKMKKSEAANLHRAIMALPKIKKATVSYALMKNLEATMVEVKSIDAAKEPYDSYKEYQKELKDLQTEHAKKDDQGDPISFKISEFASRIVFEDKEAFEVVCKELQEKHKKSIDEREKQLKEVDVLSEDDVDIKLVMIDASTLMDDSIEIDQHQLYLIRSIIKD